MPPSSASRCCSKLPYMRTSFDCSASVPAEDDLAGAALEHRLEALLEVLIGQAVGDDGRQVEPGLDHHAHLVPGLENLAPVNTLQRQHVEDDLVPVDRHLAFGNAEDRKSVV